MKKESKKKPTPKKSNKNNLSEWLETLDKIGEENRSNRKEALAVFNDILKDHKISDYVQELIYMVMNRQNYMAKFGPTGHNNDKEAAENAANRILEIDKILENLI
jgi:hypothetical protein